MRPGSTLRPVSASERTVTIVLVAAAIAAWFVSQPLYEWLTLPVQRLLPEDWVDFSTSPVLLPTEHPYGAHWWLNTDAEGTTRMPAVPPDAYWASGNEGQQVVVLPSEDRVVVRLGLTRGYDGISWGLEDLLTGVLDAAPAS